MALNFCHITPIKHLDKVSGRNHHLTLAHLVESRPEYVDFYVNEKKINPNNINILDNSAFEMVKQGKPLFPADKLIEMGKRVHADYVVLTDYPGEDCEKTINKATELAPQFKKSGLGTFFVPQSEIEDLEGLITSFIWAAQNPEIDYIGVSILAVPNAYGVEKTNNLQRFLSRWKFVNELIRTDLIHPETNASYVNFWEYCQIVGKKIHFLGMVDGPNEIELIAQTGVNIDTWDSSAAIWAGINGIRFDGSPTGLINGKFEDHVDFDSDLVWTQDAERNIRYIDSLTRKFKA